MQSNFKNNAELKGRTDEPGGRCHFSKPVFVSNV
jgi:hypothetical protein